MKVLLLILNTSFVFFSIHFKGRRGLGTIFLFLLLIIIDFLLKVHCMFGQVAMVEQMMIVIVMVMLHQCGQFPLILQLMMDEQHSTMNPVHQHWHQHLAMEEVMILMRVGQCIPHCSLLMTIEHNTQTIAC